MFCRAPFGQIRQFPDSRPPAGHCGLEITVSLTARLVSHDGQLPDLHLGQLIQIGVIIHGSGAELADIYLSQRTPDRLNDESDGDSLGKVRRHLWFGQSRDLIASSHGALRETASPHRWKTGLGCRRLHRIRLH